MQDVCALWVRQRARTCLQIVEGADDMVHEVLDMCATPAIDVVIGLHYLLQIPSSVLLGLSLQHHRYKNRPHAVVRVFRLGIVRVHNLVDIGVVAVAQDRNLAQRPLRMITVVEYVVHIFDRHPI